MEVVKLVKEYPELLENDLNIQWEYNEFMMRNFCCEECKRWHKIDEKSFFLKIDKKGEIMADICNDCELRHKNLKK